jgi:hypothetical protein
MNASRSRRGSCMRGMRVEMVRTAEVLDGAEGELARSDPELVAIGAMVVSGDISTGRASCWLTFWLTPPSFARAGGGSTFLIGGAAGRPFNSRRGPLAWVERPGAGLGGRVGSFWMIKTSSSPSGTFRAAGDCCEVVDVHRIVGSPGFGPAEGVGPGGLGTNPFDSRLKIAVKAQIAKNVSGTIARRISCSQLFMRQARRFEESEGPRSAQELTGSRLALFGLVPAMEERISVSA